MIRLRAAPPLLHKKTWHGGRHKGLKEALRFQTVYLNLWLAVTWPGCCTWLHTFVVHPLVQPTCAYNHKIHFQAQCLRAVSSTHAAPSESKYRELCVGAWVCVWSAGRG